MTTAIDRIADEQARAFAEACYDTNTIDELLDTTIPDQIDLKTWDILPEDWHEAIDAALADRLDEPLYRCTEDGYTDRVVAADAHDAAAEFFKGGDRTPNESTYYVDIQVENVLTGEEEDVRFVVHPEPPECEADDHDWQSPHSVVGGIEENPGVWGNGGGVIIREVCAHCGAYRVTDTWATDPSTGQHYESVEYEDADERSLAWIDSRTEAKE